MAEFYIKKDDQSVNVYQIVSLIFNTILVLSLSYLIFYIFLFCYIILRII